MPVYRDQRMLRRKLLLKERLNMILMPDVITKAIITAKGVSAEIIMVKVMNAVMIMAMKAAAAITARKLLRGRQNEPAGKMSVADPGASG